MRFDAVFATATVHVEPLLTERSILYPTIAIAATFEGAVQDRATDESPAVAVTPVGATGGKNGVAATGEIDGPVPAAFTAATRNA